MKYQNLSCISIGGRFFISKFPFFSLFYSQLFLIFCYCQKLRLPTKNRSPLHMKLTMHSAGLFPESPLLSLMTTLIFSPILMFIGFGASYDQYYTFNFDFVRDWLEIR